MSKNSPWEASLSTEEFPVFTAAVVQAAPVFFDPEATTELVCSYIREASSNGARLIAFPEAFISAYPYWSWMLSPLEGSKWFKRFYNSSITMDGPEVRRLCNVAKQYGVTIVIGINERSPNSLGTIYNTNLVIDNNGIVRNKHRKGVPTFAEKLQYGPGNADGLRVTRTEMGNIGVLACGENTNTLARFNLLAQGETVHVANYISFPFTNSYDIINGIKIRAGSHSFEGKIFTLVSSHAMSKEIIDLLATTDEQKEMLSGKPNAFSGIFGPDGRLWSKGIVDDEGIDYCEIDIGQCLESKQFHDIIGHYNRFDLYELRVNGNIVDPTRPVSLPTTHEIESGSEAQHECDADSKQ